MQSNVELIKQYYNYFNASDFNSFVNLLSDDVIHDLNQETRQIGRDKFLSFMHQMGSCYQETISNLVVLANETHDRYAAEFVVTGKYIATDVNLPNAKGQTYKLAAGAFFEIKNNKITRVTSYYNLNEWIRQIEEQTK